MKKLAFLGAAGALGAAVLLCGGRFSHAADHLDSPSVQTMANKMADINDVFAWMAADGNTVNLVMTVSPADDGTHSFGPSFQYVFHVNSYPGATNLDAYGKMPTETQVICTFASNTSVQCWVAAGSTVKDYVKGDPSTSVTSADTKVKVFAGPRSDPFFFNLAGLLTAKTAAEIACGGSTTPGSCPGVLPKDAAGCPTLPATVTGQLVTALHTTQDCTTPGSTCGPCPANQADCFAGFNVMALVVQVDKSLLEDAANNRLIGVWGSTHMAQ